MSDAQHETPPDKPSETNLREGEDLDEAVIVRWIIIAMVASFIVGVIFLVINAHFSPY